MNTSISNFFAPRKSQKAAIPKRRKRFHPEDGWQRPVGLTTNDAIEIVDNDTEVVGGNDQIPTIDSYSQDKRAAENEIAAASFNAVEASSVKSVSPFTRTRTRCEINYPIAVPVNKDTENDLANHTRKKRIRSSSVIDLCSPVSAEASERKSSSPVKTSGTCNSECTVAGTPSSADNPNESTSTNPFLQFAHDLGGLESSYFEDLLKSNNSKPEEANKKKENRARSPQGAPKPPSKKRKRTMVKVTNDFEFSTDEELAECRRKWQSFADVDAPIEIRRFQIVIAARLHCQAHEGTVRKAMESLRKHFREPSLNSSCLQKDENESNMEQSSGVIEKSYLSPETLSKADPEVIAKMISSVLFANVKAKHIVKAAMEVKHQFNYKVPESETSLKGITGIGPKLAGLLFRVNSYSAHDKVLQTLGSRTEGREIADNNVL